MRGHKPMINVTRGTVVCDRAILADRPLQRMRGLLGRDSLEPGEGLLLQPAPSIHTAFMRFPLDVVFLDSESVVVRVVHTLAPWRAASAQRARSVLELAAGEGARRGVEVGDWLIRVSEDLCWTSPGADHSPMDATAQGPELTDAERAAKVPVTWAAQHDAGHGMKEVLLVSRDRRFRAVMAVLLSARGFSVTPATSPSELATGVRTRPEIVVIDAGDALAETQQAAARAGLMSGNRTVVFVSDDDQATTVGARVIPKWEVPEQLCDAIATARLNALSPPPGLGEPPRRSVC
jgi:uncharacterized protein